MTILTFLEEIQATGRTGIIHMQKMPDADFVQWVQQINKQTQGRLVSPRVSLKVDGAGARFGKDPSGNPFFESSRSGPIFKPNAFSSYAQSRGASPDSVTRAQHYDAMFNIVTGSKFMQSLPDDCKVVCEVLYNAMGEKTNQGIKFVNVSYDPRQLGRVLTIVPLSVLVASTGAVDPNASTIMQKLYKYSDTDVKFVNPQLDVAGDIDISSIIQPLVGFTTGDLDTIRSRKAVDAENKNQLRNTVQTVKNQLADFILKNPRIQGRDRLGKGLEGLVLDINGQQIKVTTPEFKAVKSAEKSTAPMQFIQSLTANSTENQPTASVSGS